MNPTRSLRNAAALVLITLASGACTRTAPRLARTGTVVRASGETAVAPGQQCTVDFAPETRAGLNCRVTVRCGGRTLFGGPMLGGYAECGITQDRYSSALDPYPSGRDGDPTLRVDVARGTAVVTDERPGYRVEIALR